MPAQPPGTYNIGTTVQDCHNNLGRLVVSGVQTDSATTLFYNLFDEDNYQVGAHAFPADTSNGTIDFINLLNGPVRLVITANGVNQQTFNYLINCGGGGSGGNTCDVEIYDISITRTPEEQTATVTIGAYSAEPIQYSIGGVYQSSNVFNLVAAGNYTVTVRKVSEPACLMEAGFIVSAPEALSVVSPNRDWLPVGLPIYYTFESKEAIPAPLTIRIEVSTNGVDFNAVEAAGIIVLPPDTNKQYKVNVAPYLEAMFNPGPPAMAGNDFNLFKLYRLMAGKASAYDGITGTPEITTPNARGLYATVLTPIINNKILLSKEPYGFPSSNFSGIITLVSSDLINASIRNTPTPYAGTPDQCPKNPLQLYWLNRSGGWQTWIFDGKHEEGQDIPEPTTWKDENNRTHRASFGGISETVNVYSGFIPLSAYDTVFGILSSIRVYSREGAVWREVNIEPGAYRKHKAGQRRKELNFSFTYAETLTVQNA